MNPDNTEKVPISQKLTLTIREAAAYSNIGINKIDSMLRTPGCTFVLFVGTKKLVKRKEFEAYISNKTQKISSKGIENFGGMWYSATIKLRSHQRRCHSHYEIRYRG